ncbi:forkhead box protein O4 [Engraulis encrasicolus]|uniref:forkhead box protein O4 n=1 Tax=Engraulis encrasicolus TaxID=184585 RepID=UPI002FD6F11C
MMEEDSVPPIDPDFEPQSRPRSCTWPLPRPDISAVKPEAADGAESTAGTPPAEEDKHEPQPVTSEPEKVVVTEGGLAAGLGGATPRKGSSRRNAWGNQSYADLISQAIENSPEKRLTLAQIYDWMVKTVPYFKDKGDSNSSAGWKNSIRHNLSLHNKFLRVHNESTGKSSWWMLNPEGGKTGKAPRRRAASMDNSSKLLKSRMRAKQTKKAAMAAGLVGSGGAGGDGGDGSEGGANSPGGVSPFPKWGVSRNSPSSRGSLDDSDMWTSFRPRTSSNASTLSGKLSPIAPAQEEDDELLSEDGGGSGSLLGGYPPTLTETLMEELDLIDGLTLMTGGHQQGGASPSTAPPAPPTPLPSASTLLPRGTGGVGGVGVGGFPSFGRLQTHSSPTGSVTSKPVQSPPQSQSGGGVNQGGAGSKQSPSSYGNSLFNPLPGPGSHGGGGSGGSSHFSPRVPSSLEALLTSDSPPPSEVMMSQVDPLMPSQGGPGGPGGLLGLGGGGGGGVGSIGGGGLVGNQAKQGGLMMGKAGLGGLGLPPQPQHQHQHQHPHHNQHQSHQHHQQHQSHQQQQQQQAQQQHSQLGLSMLLSSMANQDPSQLGLGSMKSQQHHLGGVGSGLLQGQGVGGGLLGGTGLPSMGMGGNQQGMGQFGPIGSGSTNTQGFFMPGSVTNTTQDRLPTDLDIEMFTENLDCDVDYIINSDLMDGDIIDFNFDPILPPGGQGGYPGPPATTTQSSSHKWVPS